MKNFVIYLLVTFLTASIGYSQRTTRTPTTDGCFRHGVTPISNAPMYHTDMHWDCLIGYVYFDSLCRAHVTRDELDSMAALINSWDTLKPFMRFKYRMTEYNADEYAEYLIAAIEMNPSYNTYPGVIDQLITDRMNAVLGPKHKLTYLTNASIILRIHVQSIYDDVDSFASIPVEPLPMKCITAVIIDTIKGKHFRQCEQIYTSQKPQSNPACISFSFSPYWQKEHYRGDVIHIPMLDTLGNEIVPCDNCYGQNSIEVGKDYVVFLRNIYLDYDGTSTYFDTNPYNKFSAEGGIFPILENGNVSIPSNFFGYGTEISYPQFKSNLLSDINTIISH